jgi:hypothetical protein
MLLKPATARKSSAQLVVPASSIGGFVPRAALEPRPGMADGMMNFPYSARSTGIKSLQTAIWRASFERIAQLWH